MKTKKKVILDVCCGGKAFWFNKNHPNTIYHDIRKEPKGFIQVRPNYNVNPDKIGDFRNLDFPDNNFKLIVFDPPYLLKCGEKGWQMKKFGRLNKDTWKEDLLKGFNECWRVLEDYGVLIFKWNEFDISFKAVLELFPVQPLFGHPTARSGKTKWFCYMKISEEKRLEQG